MPKIVYTRAMKLRKTPKVNTKSNRVISEAPIYNAFIFSRNEPRDKYHLKTLQDKGDTLTLQLKPKSISDLIDFRNYIKKYIYIKQYTGVIDYFKTSVIVDTKTSSVFVERLS